MASFDSFMGGGDDLAAGHSYTTFDSFRYPHDHGLHRDHDLDLDYDHDHGLHHNLDLDDDREQSPPPLFTHSGGDGFNHFIDDDSPPLPPPTYHHSSHGNLFDGLEAAEAAEAEEAGEEVIRTSSSSLSRSFDASPQPHQPFDVSSGLDRLSISEGNHGSFGQDGVVDGIFGFGEPYISSNGDHGSSAALLPPLEEMQMEEGFILREWRRQNAIRLAEKERLEKEKLAQIIEVADRFKEDFYIKRSTHCESSKKNNREKEKVSLANQESFHKNADKHYWKAVGELVPHELPTAMNAKKSRGDKEKKASTLVVVQGPKPGKPTDISRMRQILLKLKHNPPEHMKAPLPQPVSLSIEKPVKPAAAANAPVVQTLAPQPVVAS